MNIMAIRNLVLCLDNEESDVWLSQSALMENGYAVLTATNGLRALQLMSLRRVDAIILTYSMPGTNSKQLAAEMKRLRPGTRSSCAQPNATSQPTH